MEALVAFFLESTFIGLWIFGWNRIPKLLHLASIWLVALGVNLSAFFIIAANSFMQHPVGARFNPVTRRAELESIWMLFTNNTGVAAFWHAVAASFLTAGTFVAAVSAWWMVRSSFCWEHLKFATPPIASKTTADWQRNCPARPPSSFSPHWP